mmetsp:Transcript_26567/g.61171  ORF Transcript_26567/g.61171 Transcript_26567/m.61171 type:complete len:549 (-) Transcript_26567:229-1875(-)
MKMVSKDGKSNITGQSRKQKHARKTGDTGNPAHINKKIKVEQTIDDVRDDLARALLYMKANGSSHKSQTITQFCRASEGAPESEILCSDEILREGEDTKTRAQIEHSFIGDHPAQMVKKNDNIAVNVSVEACSNAQPSRVLKKGFAPSSVNFYSKNPSNMSHKNSNIIEGRSKIGTFGIINNTNDKKEGLGFTPGMIEIFKNDHLSSGSQSHCRFPGKLYEILSNTEFSEVISWLPDGKAWKVRDEERFMKEIAPKYFRQTKYLSFIRQVYMWGFTKYRTTFGDAKESGAFHHKSFIKDEPQLCRKMHLPKPPEKTGEEPTQPNPVAYSSELQMQLSSSTKSNVQSSLVQNNPVSSPSILATPVPANLSSWPTPENNTQLNSLNLTQNFSTHTTPQAPPMPSTEENTTALQRSIVVNNLNNSQNVMNNLATLLMLQQAATFFTSTSPFPVGSTNHMLPSQYLTKNRVNCNSSHDAVLSYQILQNMNTAVAGSANLSGGQGNLLNSTNMYQFPSYHCMNNKNSDITPNNSATIALLNKIMQTKNNLSLG